MKRILTILGIAAISFTYAQGGTLIINNYTPYEYRGDIIANNSLGCYPIVTNTDKIIVPADSHTGNGQQLQYDNYRDQYTSSLYPNPNWTVSTSVSTTNVRPWNHASLMPGGIISNNTKWSATKFDMFDTGTGSYVTGFNANLSISTCNSSAPTPFYNTPSGSNSAEMFVIGSITYIQLY
jgi:hypothetical protein